MDIRIRSTTIHVVMKFIIIVRLALVILILLVLLLLISPLTLLSDLATSKPAIAAPNVTPGPKNQFLVISLRFTPTTRVHRHLQTTKAITAGMAMDTIAATDIVYLPIILVVVLVTINLTRRIISTMLLPTRAPLMTGPTMASMEK